MYVLKMEANKDLIITVNGVLYVGEKNAEDIVFLLPPSYEGTVLGEGDVLVRCILPDGGKYTRTLTLADMDYKGYLKYILPVTEVITAQAGSIEVWLTAYADGEKIFKTSTAVLRVRKTIGNSGDGEVTEAEINDLYLRVNELEEEKVDGLSYNKETRELQLMAEEESVGQPVKIPDDEYTARVVKLDGGRAG